MKVRPETDSFTLKWIAVIAMTLDHTALCFENQLNALSPYLFELLRIIGRMAFPIFAFLLVQGYLHTHSRRSYGIRLLIFALLSEIPFDLFHEKRLFSFKEQNVLFTLLVGLIMISLIDHFMEKELMFGSVLSAALCFAAAYFLRFDLALPMLLIILMFSVFRYNRTYACLGSLLACLFEWPAFLPLPLIFICHKQGKKQMKYFFYLYYPLHLLLLGLPAYFLRS